MNIKILAAGALLILLSGFGCNVEDLLKGGTSEPPNVGNIKTDAVNFEVQPLDTARFWIEAEDPMGGTLSYQWRINAGEIIGSGSTEELIWRAPITGGNYSLFVDVSNSEEMVTRSEVIKVPSIAEPKVKIISPEPGTFLVQYTNIIIEASASHENNIQEVQMWFNEQYIPLTPEFRDNIYLFNWKIDAMPGSHELKVRAVAQVTGAVGADSIIVFVEGIVEGKK